jgi:hypothetical protein
MNTLQEHSTSLNSVPCANFRGSLRDCAIHSSSWVHFADFGLVGFVFIVLLVKMMRAFVSETTARLRCVRLFVKLYSVTYVAICCLSHMAIMCHHERGSKDIFRPHTEASTCGRRAFFIPWTAGINIFSGFVTSTLLCGLPMGTPWLLMSDDASMFCARKKRVNKKNYTTSNRFFLFFTYPHACMRA